MFKLYELTEMYNNIYDLIGDDEVTNEQMVKALESIEDNINPKVDNMAKLMKEIDSSTSGLKEEEKRLAGRRKALENKQASIKNYLEFQLEQLKLDKVKTELFTVALQNNKASVKFINEDLIPNEYKILTTTMSIPKQQIYDDIKAGKEIAGVELVQTRSLRIR